MADNATTPTPTPAPAATARRKTAATNRSTAAKKAAATRTRRQADETRTRSAAAKKAAETRREAKRTPVERYVDMADKAMTIQIGAALVARDTVVSTVGELAKRYSSVDLVERELRARQRRLETDMKRFERRGAKARTEFEKELRRRRARVEHDLRSLRINPRDLGAQAEHVGARVENLVQSGITASTQAAAKVTERVPKIA